MGAEPSYVFDASAVLAVMCREDGYENLAAYCAGAQVSTVQLAEVLNTVLRRDELKLTPAKVWRMFSKLGFVAIDFDKRQTKLTQEVAASCRRMHDETLAKQPVNKKAATRFNLSLGDRCCSALGMASKAIVITSDSAWMELGLKAEIVAFRPPRGK